MIDFRIFPVLARQVAAAIIRVVCRFLIPSIDSILADFEKKIGKLDALLDAENEYIRQQQLRREELRAQISVAWDEQEAAEQRAARASAVRDNLRGIINA